MEIPFSYYFDDGKIRNDFKKLLESVDVDNEGANLHFYHFRKVQYD
jgi:hypothetical protein